MEIIKCDICKKTQKDKIKLRGKWVSGRIFGKESLFFDLCEKCSTRMVKYIKKYLKVGNKK